MEDGGRMMEEWGPGDPGCNGFSWIFMDCHGFSWMSMDCHGCSVTFMDVGPEPLIFIDVHGLSWIWAQILGF